MAAAFFRRKIMALVKFISGDGVEHEVEETSMAAEIMRQNGFIVISIDGERQPVSAIEPEASIVYTEEEAVAQNDGVDESSTAKEKKPAAKKKANA